MQEGFLPTGHEQITHYFCSATPYDFANQEVKSGGTNLLFRICAFQHANELLAHALFNVILNCT